VEKRSNQRKEKNRKEKKAEKKRAGKNGKENRIDRKILEEKRNYRKKNI
jgi:hypothetical protein